MSEETPLEQGVVCTSCGRSDRDLVAEATAAGRNLPEGVCGGCNRCSACHGLPYCIDRSVLGIGICGHCAGCLVGIGASLCSQCGQCRDNAAVDAFCCSCEDVPAGAAAGGADGGSAGARVCVRCNTAAPSVCAECREGPCCSTAPLRCPGCQTCPQCTGEPHCPVCGECGGCARFALCRGCGRCHRHARRLCDGCGRCERCCRRRCEDGCGRCERCCWCS